MRWLPLVLLVAISLPAVAEESDRVHRMLAPDGEADVNKCGMCHEEDFSLSRSKVETCTLCHGVTVHGGTAEHLRASPASVAARVAAAKAPGSELPLAEDGRMYCGTCHFFHDPRVAEETPLAAAWVPASSGLPEAVRRSLALKWEEITAKHGESDVGARFARQSTRALRLRVDDGSLCRHCHGDILQ